MNDVVEGQRGGHLPCRTQEAPLWGGAGYLDEPITGCFFSFFAGGCCICMKRGGTADGT
jgi:hypothetical protein